MRSICIHRHAGCASDVWTAPAGVTNMNGSRDEMPNTYTRIETTADLDRLLEESEQRVVILFNHDPWCPVSGRASREMSLVQRDIVIVDVSRARDVTAAISQRTGVRHESPQVIVLYGGRQLWNASHFGITAGAVEEAAAMAEQRTASD